MDKLQAAVCLLSIAAITITTAMSVIGRKYLESLARQPEMAAMLQVRFLVLAGLTDAVPMVMLLIGLSLIFLG